MTRKRPSSADYLDALDEGKRLAPSRKTPATSTAEPGERKRKNTLYFLPSLLEEARSAVLEIGLKGDEPSNLSRLFEAALERELVRLRKIHNAGEPLKLYKRPLPGGRPPKR